MAARRPSSPCAPALMVALAVLVSAVGPQGALADTEDGTVSFCFNDWPPYAEMTEDGPNGISVDVLREAAHRAGLAPTFQELPWNRCLALVRQGAIDAVIDAAARSEYLQGPTSFSVYSNTIWVGDDNRMMVLEFSALAGTRIGLVAGYEYPQALLDEIAANGMVIEYSVDDAANVRQLAFGRVEAIVGDFVGTLGLAEAGALAIHALAPAHSIDSLYPSFNPERVALHRAIDAALFDMLTDGTIDRIYRDHVGAAFSEVLGQ